MFDFTLVRDGYQTLQVDECLSQPWYEFPGLDFISENLIPWTIRDVRRFTYQMVPLQVLNTRELRDDRGEPAAALTDSVLERMKDAGYLLGKTGPGRNVLTLMPPLVVAPDHLDAVIDGLDRALAAGR